MRRPRGVFTGLATVDVIHRVPRHPGPNEKITAARVDLAPGGPATGAAITFAALGGQAELITALGRTPFATAAAHALAQHGVTVHDLAPESQALPPLSSVMVNDTTGDRAVVSRNAEDQQVDPTPEIGALVSGADALLIDGHHPQLARAAAEAARESGICVVQDLGSWKIQTEGLLALTDVVISSADTRTPDGEAAGQNLLGYGPKVAAVTHGPQPVRWWAGNNHGQVPVPQVHAQDTLGAGDVFHGAFAYAQSMGSTMVDALDWAGRVAAVRVSHRGPVAWLSDPALDRLVTDLTNATS